MTLPPPPGREAVVGTCRLTPAALAALRPGQTLALAGPSYGLIVVSGDPQPVRIALDAEQRYVVRTETADV